MKSIFFARHGQSQANANGTLAFPDTTLTELGINQAQVLARQLQKLNIVHIVSSPMNRAISTARIVAQNIGVESSKITILESLRERNVGVLHGTKKLHPGIYYYKSVIDNIEKAEGVTQLIKRMKECWNQLEETSRHVDGNILAVGHTISGYYLRQVSTGRMNFKEDAEIIEIANANYIKLG